MKKVAETINKTKDFPITLMNEFLDIYNEYESNINRTIRLHSLEAISKKGSNYCTRVDSIYKSRIVRNHNIKKEYQKR